MNEKIRTYAKEKKVKLWQVAEEYGMRDTNFSKILRHPLPEDQEKRILAIIDAISMSGSTSDK